MLFESPFTFDDHHYFHYSLAIINQLRIEILIAKVNDMHAFSYDQKLRDSNFLPQSTQVLINNNSPLRSECIPPIYFLQIFIKSFALIL